MVHHTLREVIKTNKRKKLLSFKEKVEYDFFDNSRPEPVLVYEFAKGADEIVHDQTRLTKIKKYLS